MSVTPPRLPLAALFLVAATAIAAAQAGPFGVALPEPAPAPGGLFGTIAGWQSGFYRELTGLLKAMKTDGTAGLWLIAFSFAYGVLHAAGPGHGKAVVSAYVLANRETARNGAILAMVSALAQAATAIGLVLVASVLLKATAMAMTEATRWFEIGSFALISALGVWLVWRKILRPLAGRWAARYAPVAVGGLATASAGGYGGHAHGHGHGHVHHRHHGHDHGHHGHHHHVHEHHGDHHHDHDHAGCGHAHAPPPSLAAGRLDWRKAWATVAAVGMRPCTGALIVLVFALSQGLFVAGMAAAVAMAVGTGITVAALTLAAVSARGLAGRLSGDGARAQAVHASIEGLGAAAVLAFGLLMLGASLAA